MVASEACSEPQCLCASPLRLRMNTSHSGVFGVAIVTSLKFLFGRLRGWALPAFLGIGGRRLAHPPSLIMRLAPRCDSITVAGTVARKHLIEFGPVDRAVDPVPGLVLLHAGIGDGQPKELRL